MRTALVVLASIGPVLLSTPIWSGSVGEVLFIRGDANDDGRVNSSDASYVTNYLFHGGPSPSCMDAADADDDGFIDQDDATYVLIYLYSNGPPPLSPFSECGLDPTSDYIDCDEQDSCE